MSAGRLSILLVEDDEDDYILTRELLSENYREGFQLDWKTGYDDGLKALLKGGHDVCLLDYRLGEHSGIDLLRRRPRRRLRDARDRLDGSRRPLRGRRSNARGAADFLVKGQFAAPLLERSIRYAIERQRAPKTPCGAARHASPWPCAGRTTASGIGI